MKRREAQREVSTAKNLYWERICEEVDLCTGKGLRMQNKDSAGISLISIEEWK